MSLRLLPFRQYNEHDVVNIFALESDLALTDTNTDGEGSNGVFVKITNGNFDQDVITYGNDSYLGKTDYPFVGGNMYPTNPLTLSGAGANDTPLGVTLNQTAKADENGEKLLYNAVKKEELQAVLPGQTVPVATKGIFTLSSDAFDGPLSTYTVGNGIQMSDVTAGKITGAGTDLNASGVFGTVIGSGTRNAAGHTSASADQFSGEFLVVKF
jgi:hypothetical protein